MALNQMPLETEMELKRKYEFELTLANVFESIGNYVKDVNGEKQLKFDPPVYQNRYGVVINILTSNKWKDKIKKVT